MKKELIERITVGAGGASSIEFTSIPQDGVSLVLMFSGRGTIASVSRFINVLLNGDEDGNYNYMRLRGDGSAFTSASSATKYRLEIGLMPGDSATANTFGSCQTHIANYTSSTIKSVSTDVVTENNATEAYANLVANTWDGPAITSINISTSGNIAEHSTASLYKVVTE